MGEVTINKMNGETIHFINSSCRITGFIIVVKQYNDDGTHEMHTFNKRDIKSVIYDVES